MYFDVFGVFWCFLHHILCASVTFCHPPLCFCWEQRAFRLCTGQSSKLLFVFLRWGKGKNTMQQTKSNKKCTSSCLARPNRSNRSLNWRSLYYISKLAAEIHLHDVITYRGTRRISKRERPHPRSNWSRNSMKLLFLGKQALSLIRQSGKDGKVLLHWQGRAHFELFVLVVSWEGPYSLLLLHRLPEYCWQDLTRTNRPNDTWNLMDLDAVSWREWPWATKPTKPQASKKFQNACHHVVVVCFGSQQLAHRCFLISVSMSSNVI